MTKKVRCRFYTVDATDKSEPTKVLRAVVSYKGKRTALILFKGLTDRITSHIDTLGNPILTSDLTTDEIAELINITTRLAQIKNYSKDIVRILDADGMWQYTSSKVLKGIIDACRPDNVCSVISYLSSFSTNRSQLADALEHVESLSKIAL